METTGYQNPFKNGKFKNPGVDVETSRKRLASKLKRIRKSNCQ